MYNVRIYDFHGEKQVRIYERVNMGRKSQEDKERDAKKRAENKLEKQGNGESGIREIIDTERSRFVSMNRTVNAVYEYTRSNQWEYFVTLTFNKEMVQRYDYADCTHALGNFLHHTRKYNKSMRYVIVPELHEDGAYHFHGLFSEIPNVEMKDSGVYSFGKYTIHKDHLQPWQIKQGRLIYNMERYKYGHSDMQYVESSERASSYLTKYITKELVASTKNKKRYWASRNLDKPTITEHLLSREEIGDLVTLLKDRIAYDKTVNVEVGDYTNSIRYLELRSDKAMKALEEKGELAI